MRYVPLIVIGFAAAFLSGCASSRDLVESSASAMKPRSRDYRDDANLSDEYHDEFDIVGKEGRGHMAMEHESDGLTKYLESPKARAINRNLGFD